MVAPGYPPKLIQELLKARLLPPSADLAVLLPPEKTGQYDQLITEKNFYGVRFHRSPGRKFFSTPHLKWLRSKLQSSENNLVLISNSLDRDFTGALVAFVTLLLTGKSITKFHKARAAADENQEPDIDSRDQILSGQWTSREFNPKMLAREILIRVTFAPPGHPWKFNEILYFLMFASLIIKQRALNHLFPLSHKLRKM